MIILGPGNSVAWLNIIPDFITERYMTGLRQKWILYFELYHI